MRRLLAAVLMLIVICALATRASYGAGIITGNLTDRESSGLLPGISVQVFGASNAVLVAEGKTSETGAFTVSVASGEYKLRFSGAVGNDCYSQFYGTEGLDVFLSGTVLKVSDNASTAASAELWRSQFCAVLCQLEDVSFAATLYDSLTNQGVQGVQITLMDPENAVPRSMRSPLITDSNGVASGSDKWCGATDAKIRISDPAGLYKPEFYGAGDRDEFQFGSVLNLSPSATFKEGIARLTAADTLTIITQNILDMGLDPAAETSLSGTVSSAAKVLADDNPNNDKAACGMLKGFVNQLDAKVNNGTLTSSQADALATQSAQVRSMLGCK